MTRPKARKERRTGHAAVPKTCAYPHYRMGAARQGEQTYTIFEETRRRALSPPCIITAVYYHRRVLSPPPSIKMLGYKMLGYKRNPPPTKH